VKVVITGGSGFLGQLLTRRLLEVGELTGPSGDVEPIERLVSFDAVAPAGGGADDPSVEVVVGDIADRGVLATLVDRDEVSVFHLASMVSAGSELDFDGALSVNLDGTRAVLEACRARRSRPRVVFTSSVVAFGGVAPDEAVTDTTKLTPETTYGMTKAVSELLVNDYTRKGFLDGRSARLPTVVVRPGRPNAAASSWVSGIFREPLNGEECVIPVELDMRLPVAGYRTVVENLIRLHELDAGALGRDRGLNLPALAPSVEEMIAALERAADRPLGALEIRPDPDVVGFFAGWARDSEFGRATELGLRRDDSLEGIVRAYIEDFLGPERRAAK